MSHAIDMSNDRANMAFAGEVPWHGLGQTLTKDADIDVWKKEAGLEWQILRSTVKFQDADKHLHSFSERHALYRSDTFAPLSIVGSEYKIVQPGEVLEFYRDLVAAAGFKLSTAGSLRGGRAYWALAELDKEMVIMGKDRLEGYLLLATSCDNTMATRAKFTSVRVVCQNTLHLADKDGEPTIRIPHSRMFDAKKVKEDLGVADEAWAEFEETVQLLAKRKVSEKETEKWVMATFGDPQRAMDDQPNPRVIAGILESIKSSPGSDLKSADGTAWGLVNGVTFYFDHARKTRTLDARLNDAWFGNGSRFKRDALQNALKLVA